jgi:terminase small subunit-like protein
MLSSILRLLPSLPDCVRDDDAGPLFIDANWPAEISGILALLRTREYQKRAHHGVSAPRGNFAYCANLGGYNSPMPRGVGHREAKNLTKPKRAVGRPARYTPALAARICVAIATGSTLGDAAKTCGVGRRTVARWRFQHPEFRSMYEQARLDRNDMWGEEIVEIADGRDADYEIGANGQTVQVKENVLRSRLRMEGRQWVMSRLAPQQWGERQQVDLKADMLLQMPEEQRVKKALELLDMVREVVNRPKERRPIRYDNTDGDILAEQERQERERQRQLEYQPEEGEIGR